MIFQTLRQFLDFTHRTLSTYTYKKVWRLCSAPLQDLLFNEVLLKQDFTTLGAARLMQDFIAIQNTLAIHSSRKALPGMAKLEEVC